MKKALVFSLVFALLFAVTTASASTPLAITIDSTMDINTGTGTFTASGPAVDAGIFCPSGTAYDPGYLAMGWQSNIRLNLHGPKQLICADGSGEVVLMLNVRIFYSASESYSNWVIAQGTGDYTRLRGEGKITATGVNNLVFDHYTGLMHQN